MKLAFNPIGPPFDLVGSPAAPGVTLPVGLDGDVLTWDFILNGWVVQAPQLMWSDFDCGPISELNAGWVNKINCGNLPMSKHGKKIDLGVL